MSAHNEKKESTKLLFVTLGEDHDVVSKGLRLGHHIPGIISSTVFFIDMFENRRLVIFAGPHKSASSTVQEFFMKTASSISQHHPALVNWTWPYNPRRRSYLPRKGFAPLVVEGPGFVQLIHDTICSVWNSSDTHLILGTEELDRFGTAPWSGRDGLGAIRGVYNVTRPSSMEIVVNYRRPRRDQWVSIWKQLTRSDPIPYAQFLCDPSEYLGIWEYLDSVANPLGLAKAVVQERLEYGLDGYARHICRKNGCGTCHCL